MIDNSLDALNLPEWRIHELMVSEFQTMKVGRTQAWRIGLLTLQQICAVVREADDGTPTANATEWYNMEQFQLPNFVSYNIIVHALFVISVTVVNTLTLVALIFNKISPFPIWVIIDITNLLAASPIVIFALYQSTSCHWSSLAEKILCLLLGSSRSSSSYVQLHKGKHYHLSLLLFFLCLCV